MEHMAHMANTDPNKLHVRIMLHEFVCLVFSVYGANSACMRIQKQIDVKSRTIYFMLLKVNGEWINEQ